MKFSNFNFHGLYQPIRNPTFLKLFLSALPLIAGSLFLFINPGKLDGSDFMQIGWNPGQELLRTGSIDLHYPYPLWTVVVLLPFAVWPSRVAIFLWYISNILMLAAGLAIFIRLFEWEISAFLFVLVVCLSTFFLPTLTGIWLGQLSIFSFLILVLAVQLFRQQHLTWLGIILGLSFIKPQVMLLLSGLLLLWALWKRHWNTLLGFGSVILVLTLISLPFISSPGQILGGGVGYHLATYIGSTSTLWGLLLTLGIPWFVPLVISLALILWLGWIWLPTLRVKPVPFQHMLFLFSAAILVNLITIPYSWMHNLVLLLLPLGSCFNLIFKRKAWQRYTWLAALIIIMHPLAVGLFILLNKSSSVQTYQIIPALVLLPVMGLLEHQAHLLPS
jgi:Glycosyltransferase family 87